MSLRDQIHRIKQAGHRVREEARSVPAILSRVVDGVDQRWEFLAMVSGTDEAGGWVSGGFGYTSTAEARWSKVSERPRIGDLFAVDGVDGGVYKVESAVLHENAVEWKVSLKAIG